MAFTLKEIYWPIAHELRLLEECIEKSLRESKNSSIFAMNEVLLESRGKRMRPALVILSERAASPGRHKAADMDTHLITVAAAVELIHMASLIHDDILDEAATRHGKPSINSRWGNHVSLVLGDYIYSKAFELISRCMNPEVFTCMSEAIYEMCEGELEQVTPIGQAGK
jgi:heptaprenyl diphosphate synthase